MNKNLAIKQIDGAELRYLRESDAEDYDPACLKGIVRTIDAMLKNLESQQNSAMPGSHPDTAQNK